MAITVTKTELLSVRRDGQKPLSLRPFINSDFLPLPSTILSTPTISLSPTPTRTVTPSISVSPTPSGEVIQVYVENGLNTNSTITNVTIDTYDLVNFSTFPLASGSSGSGYSPVKTGTYSIILYLEGTRTQDMNVTVVDSNNVTHCTNVATTDHAVYISNCVLNTSRNVSITFHAEGVCPSPSPSTSRTPSITPTRTITPTITPSISISPTPSMQVIQVNVENGMGTNTTITNVMVGGYDLINFSTFPLSSGSSGAGYSPVASGTYSILIFLEGTRTQEMNITVNDSNGNILCANVGISDNGINIGNCIFNTSGGVEVVFHAEGVCPSPSPSTSRTPSRTATPSITPTITKTPSITPSITPSRTKTPSVTPSITASRTRTPSVTPSITISRTRTPSVTPSITRSVTITPSKTPSKTPSQSMSGYLYSADLYICPGCDYVGTSYINNYSQLAVGKYYCEGGGNVWYIASTTTNTPNTFLYLAPYIPYDYCGDACSNGC